MAGPSDGPDILLLVVVATLGGACLRAPLGDDAVRDTDVGSTSRSGSTGEVGRSDETGGTETDSTTGSLDPECHPSYLPCLPIVDDLDCDDVRALDAAPVQVVGDDEYRLDADHDGIGCEG